MFVRMNTVKLIRCDFWSVLFLPFPSKYFKIYAMVVRMFCIRSSLQRIVDYCGSLPMSGFFVTSPKRPFTRLWGNKTEIKKFTENYGLKQTLYFLPCFTQCQTKKISG